MALTRIKKNEVVAQVSGLLDTSKLTVIAKYDGTSVSAMQQLRRDAKASSTEVRVVKNRLFKQALSGSDRFKTVDTGEIKGQLLYAFNPEDEVAPAQVLAAFAKTQPQIQFVGAITADGEFLAAGDVNALAVLPSKDQLRAQLAGTVAGPLSGFVSVLGGNIRGLLGVMQARSESM